jgi:hypothetical protein
MITYPRPVELKVTFDGKVSPFLHFGRITAIMHQRCGLDTMDLVRMYRCPHRFLMALNGDW